MMKVKVFSLSIIVVIIMSCKTKMQQRKILIDNMVEAKLENEYCTELKILETFPNNINCRSNRTYANLYICRRNSLNDTVYVFDLCNKAPAYSLDKSFKDNVCIMKENYLSHFPHYVSILVPKPFTISKRSKFIFASLTRLLD